MRVQLIAVLAVAFCLRAEVRIVIQTEAGTIEAALDDRRAPITVANFLKYVDAGHYNGGQFHRTVRTMPDNQPQSAVKIDVVQAGVNADFRKQGFPAIALERTRDTGLKHAGRRVVDGARRAGQRYQRLRDLDRRSAELDFGGRRNPDGQGFAVFGRVTSGIDVARKIHRSPSGPSNATAAVAAGDQRLTPPIRILSIRRSNQ